MSAPYNEPAFPIAGGVNEHEFVGMTLRDYFAGKAITGLLAGSMADGSSITNEGIESAAMASYLIASAMLKVRSA